MGKTKQNHHKTNKKPHSLPNLPCLANSEVIHCFGSDKFFSKAILYTKRLHSNMQLNIAFLNRSGHTEHAVNTSLQDFSKSSAE